MDLQQDLENLASGGKRDGKAVYSDRGLGLLPNYNKGQGARTLDEGEPVLVTASSRAL